VISVCENLFRRAYAVAAAGGDEIDRTDARQGPADLGCAEAILLAANMQN
jgi:hypothetical protein